MRRFRDWSLRPKVALLLLVASVLPLAVMAFIEYRSEREQIIQGTTALLAARADQVSRELDAFHDAYRRSVARLARLPDVRRYGAASTPQRERLEPVILATLNAWPGGDPDFRGLGILDASGVVVVGTEKPLVGRSLALHRHVQEALRGAPVISDLHYTGAEVASTPTIAYLAPAKDPGGKVLVVAVLWIRASAIWRILEAANAQAGVGSFVVLFDNLGVRIGHSYDRNIVLHPGGVLDRATLDAMVTERRFGDRTRELLEAPRPFPTQFELARSPSPGGALFRDLAPGTKQFNYGVPRRLTTTPWTLFYMRPEKWVFAPLSELIEQTAIVAAIVIVLALAGGVVVTRGIIRQLRAASSDLAAASAEILAATTQQASGTAEAAAAIQETSTTVDEVSQTARMVAQKARAVADLAQKTARASDDGGRAVEGSVTGIQETRARMEALAGRIVVLSEQGQAIGEIIASVNDLAEQSNLLAVNAAIEAAKAGELGKGFAVVAAEVKALAGQSKQATTRVRGILNEIQRATEAAATAAEQGVKASEEGVSVVARTGDTIQVLSESVTESAQAAQQILVSAQQQAAGMDQVATAMQSIQQASTQNMAATRQAERAAQNLNELARQLRALVGASPDGKRFG